MSKGPKTIKTLADLCPDPDNANRGTERGRGMLEDSLRQLGAGRSILIDKHGRILAGNKTVEVAADIGLDNVIVVQSDGTKLVAVQRTDLDLETDPMAKRLALADNRVGMVDLDFDPAILAALQEEDADLLKGLWTDGELDELLADVLKGEPKADPGAQIDRAAELQEKWGTATGQLWEIGQHRLLCGDSTDAAVIDRVTLGTVVGAIIFDPPYDADKSVLDWRYPCRDVLVFTDHRHLLDCVTGWGEYRCLFVWDGVTSWYVPGWPLARGKFCLWFGSGEYNQDGAHYGEPDEPHVVTNIRGTYHYKPDPRGKHLSTVFQSPNTKEDAGHKHSKPLDWMRMLMGNCTAGAVFDPFVGSGTSLVACEQLGRPCYGIELDPATVAVALERMAELGLEPRLKDV